MQATPFAGAEQLRSKPALISKCRPPERGRARRGAEQGQHCQQAKEEWALGAKRLTKRKCDWGIHQFHKGAPSVFGTVYCDH